MDTVVVATSAADSAAAEAVRAHHAELAGRLQAHVAAVVSAAVTGNADAAGASRHTLLTWCERELLPHARAEETTMYAAAHEEPEGRLLVDALLAEHGALIALVESVRSADSPLRAAMQAEALRAVFDSHLSKENEQVLPLLASSSRVSLHTILDGMHEVLGSDPAAGHDEAAEGGAAGHGCGCGCGGGEDSHDADAAAEGHACGCGESDGHGLPELDARVVPHKIRHATVLGALATVESGGGLVLVAPHDPLPLLRQIEGRFPGVFAVDYLERGPEAWRLRFQRP